MTADPPLEAPSPSPTGPSVRAPARPLRGGALDALRLLAALFVVVFHFGDEAPIPLRELHDILSRGYLATDFFLILSGFVLARAYGGPVVEGRVSFGRFWFKRLARCYPTHIITLALLVVMVVTAGWIGVRPTNVEQFDFSGLPAQVFLLHAFGQGGGHWNIPAWTISTLLICYAAFPLAWRTMLRAPSPSAALATGLMILVAADLISLSLAGTQQFDLPLEWSLMRAAPLFLIGLTLARAAQTARMDGRTARLVGLGGGAALVVNGLLAGPDILSILAICAVILGCGGAPVTRAIPGAVWGARVSFSLFMIHTLTGAVWFDGARPIAEGLWSGFATGPGAWAVWLGAIVATLAAADLYDRFVDAPIQRVLARTVFAPGSRVFRLRPAPRPAPRPATAPNG